MGRLKVTGMGEWTLELEKLSNPATGRRIAKKAVYDGAAVMKDAILKAVEGVRETHYQYDSTRPWWGTPDWPVVGLTPEQKAGLLEGFGIAPIKQSGGVWSTKTSFTGFNAAETEAYPSGQPNSLVAARLENGASYRQREPVISNAIKQAKAKAEAAMQATGEAEILKTKEK